MAQAQHWTLAIPLDVNADAETLNVRADFNTHIQGDREDRQDAMASVLAEIGRRDKDAATAAAILAANTRDKRLCLLTAARKSQNAVYRAALLVVKLAFHVPATAAALPDDNASATASAIAILQAQKMMGDMKESRALATVPGIIFYTPKVTTHRDTAWQWWHGLSATLVMSMTSADALIRKNAFISGLQMALGNEHQLPRVAALLEQVTFAWEVMYDLMTQQIAIGTAMQNLMATLMFDLAAHLVSHERRAEFHTKAYKQRQDLIYDPISLVQRCQGKRARSPL